MNFLASFAEHLPAHFDNAIPPVRPVSVVPHLPTHGNSSRNSQALLSCDRLGRVNGPEGEKSPTASGRAASSAWAHVFEHASGAGQAVTEADTVASRERHPVARFW